jgi:hypothetical protein
VVGRRVRRRVARRPVLVGLCLIFVAFLAIMEPLEHWLYQQREKRD